MDYISKKFKFNNHEVFVEGELIPEKIEYVLSDYDDTVALTYDLFVDAIEEFSRRLSKVFGKEEGKINSERYLFEMYDKKGKYNGDINMITTTNDFVSSLEGCTEEEEEFLRFPLHNLYNRVPREIEGSYSLYGKLLMRGYKIIFVTHSGEDWGKLKIQSFKEQVKQFVTNDSQNSIKGYYIPLSGKKNAESFKRMFKEFDIDPKKCVHIGDSQSSDIEAAAEAGVEHIIWFDRRKIMPLMQQREPKEYEGVSLRRTNTHKRVSMFFGIENFAVN